MTTYVLQCLECKFFKTLKLQQPEDEYICSKYPNGIPKFVDDASQDCPKFEEQ